MSRAAPSEPGSADLQREIGLWSATTLNMIDMIGDDSVSCASRRTVMAPCYAS